TPRSGMLSPSSERCPIPTGFPRMFVRESIRRGGNGSHPRGWGAATLSKLPDWQGALGDMSVEDCQINTSRIGNLQNEAPGRRLVTTWPGRRLPTHTNTRGNLRSPPRAHRLQRLGREPGVEALVGPDRAVVLSEQLPTAIRPRPCVRAPQSPIGPYDPRPAEPLVPPSGNCLR